MLFALVAEASVTKKDSLLAWSRTAPNDSVLASLYAELSFEYRLFNNDSALYYANLTIKKAEQLGNERLLATGYQRKGMAWKKMGNWKLAHEAFYEALRIRERHGWLVDVGRCLMDIGNTYLDEGIFLERDTNDVGAKQQYKLALQHYEQAFDKMVLANDTAWMADAMYNIGNAHYYLYNDDMALECYFQSDQWYIQIGKVEGRADVLLAVGLIHHVYGRLDSALHYYSAAEQQYILTNNIKNRIPCCIDLAELYKELNAHEQVLNYLLLADSLALVLNDQSRRIEINENLYAYHLSLNDYEKALKYFRRYQYIKGQVLNEAVKSKVNELHIRYQTEKKEQDNQLLKQENEWSREQLLYSYLGGGTLLVLLGLIFFFYRQRKIAQHLAAQNKINTMILEQDKKYFNAIMEGQENERKRVSQELHDRMGGLLSTVKIHLGNLGNQLKKQSVQYKTTEALLNDAIEEIRKISNDMVSSVLLNFGLVPALRDLADTINSTGKLKVVIKTFGMEERLSNRVEINCFRMVQEMVTNALKHSEANTLTIRISRKANQLQLVIKDDGKGFNPKLVEQGKGLGLKNIDRRVASLGGTMKINTAAGSGVIFTLYIPLSND